MTQRQWRLFGGLSAAMMALAATTAAAGDLGLVVNGDVETISRFDPHGVPGVDHPNGYPDGWHHSSNAAWSNGTTDPSVSPSHSLFLPDDNAGGLANVDNEFRSFALAIPGVGGSGRTLDLSWKWNWDITSTVGDKFSATVRISNVFLPRPPNFDLVGTIADHIFLTDGSANSGGFQTFATSIPLATTDAAFDVIFRTWDRVGSDNDRTETGVMFVDDVRADVVPEPAALGLLGLGGLGLMAATRRRCG